MINSRRVYLPLPTIWVRLSGAVVDDLHRGLNVSVGELCCTSSRPASLADVERSRPHPRLVP